VPSQDLSRISLTPDGTRRTLILWRLQLRFRPRDHEAGCTHLIVYGGVVEASVGVKHASLKARQIARSQSQTQFQLHCHGSWLYTFFTQF
jgi:hypothetical protein